jgi:hypothetical protein
VSVEAVLKVLKTNAVNVKQVFLHMIPKLAALDWTETIAEKHVRHHVRRRALVPWSSPADFVATQAIAHGSVMGGH